MKWDHIQVTCQNGKKVNWSSWNKIIGAYARGQHYIFAKINNNIFSFISFIPTSFDKFFSDGQSEGKSNSVQSKHKLNVCLDKCSFSDCHFLCWRSSCKGQEKEAWEYLFRRKKYAASTLSEVTNTTKLRSQGSFLVFHEGEKKQRKCNDLAFLLTMTIFENFLTKNSIFIYASFNTILPQFSKILKVVKSLCYM